MRCVWYRRVVDVPADWKGRRVLLHFGAIDYDATIWADGREVQRHRGGHTPVRCDLGDVGGTSVTIVVRARDLHDRPYARGKQSTPYANAGCHYTRTTGIWQTVWMEPVPSPALGQAAGHARRRQRVLPRHAAARRRRTRGLPHELEVPRDAQRRRRRGRVGDVRRARLLADAHAADPGGQAAAVVARRPAPVRPDVRAAPRREGPRPGDRLRRPPQRQHRRHGDQAQRRERLPTPRPRPGLLPRRHPDGPDGRCTSSATSS